MNQTINDWDSAYRLRPYLETHPHPLVNALPDRVDPLQYLHWLDLGCGDGRHMVTLGKRGWQVVGLDLALWGVPRTAERLALEEIPANLTCADIRHIPLTSDSFDGVLSIQVIHHQILSDIFTTFAEIRRVLRPEGLLFATLPEKPPDNWKDGQYKEIETRTLVPIKGFERGLPHHFFTQAEIYECLKGFELLEMAKDDGGYTTIFAQKQ